MSRTVRDSNLESRTARNRLEARGKPYFRTIEPGLHLGYRKPLSGAGKWVLRHYVGGQTYKVETLATADDFSDADSVAILNFREAQQLARERMVSRAHTAAGITGPFTVSAALDQYVDFLEGNRKTGRDARIRVEALIRPELGEIEVAALTADKIRKWLSDLAKTAPRLRTKAGKAQKFRTIGTDVDSVRRRKASANRTLTVLKAALNRSWREGKVPSDAAWRRVQPFEGVDAARVRYLTLAEAKRLVNGSETHFRRLVQGALQSGARYGELARLVVADFNPDSGTLAVRQSKSGSPRHIVLTDEGIVFFKSICAGRAGEDLIFTRAGGGPWAKSYQVRPMIAACEAARLKPAIGFHGLRHTWASHSVMGGVPLLIVAKNLGHSDTRMVERHYGHMSPSHVADAIRAGAPRFGTLIESNVATMGWSR